MLLRHAEAHLTEEDQRLGLRGGKAARGELERGVVRRGQRRVDPEKAKRGRMDERDLAERRMPHILELAKARVELALDALELLLLLYDGGLLRAQLFFDRLYIAVLQKISDLGEWHVHRAQIPDGVERLKLADAVVAVIRRRVDVFRRDKAERLVVAQAAHAEMENFCRFADGEKLGKSHL